MCHIIVIRSGSGTETQIEITKFETYQIQQSGYMIIESILAKQYPIRGIQMNPEYYLGNDLDVQENGTINEAPNII